MKGQLWMGTLPLMLGLLIGCGGAQSMPPQRVNVDIVGLMLGPSLPDGTLWDGTGTVPTTLKTQLADALAAVNPYAGVAALLTDAVLVGTQAPDPYGTAEISVSGTFNSDLAYSFFQDRNSNQEDTYSPSISHPGWSSVSLDEGTRIRVTCFDEDLLNDDSAGVAEISVSDLKAALNAGKIFHVNVADQTNNRLLFVDLSVRSAR